MDMSLSKLWEMAKNREAWHAAVHVSRKELDTTEQSTEQQQHNVPWEHQRP